MRLANVPIALALPMLGIASAVVGFRGALPWALMLYGIAFVAYLVMKRRVMAHVGRFDNAWPLSSVIAYLVAPKLAGTLTLLLALSGWGALLASVYLFLRLWIWFPSELFILPGLPVVGALVTVSALWVADVVVDIIIRQLLFRL
jgi:hypothetical protein